MTSRAIFPPLQGVSTVRTGAAAGLLSGLLSLLDPPMAALTGTLAVLTLIGWLDGLRGRTRAGRRRRWPATLTSLLILAVGGMAFLGAIPGLGSSRGAALGIALVPLGWTARLDRHGEVR